MATKPPALPTFSPTVAPDPDSTAFSPLATAMREARDREIRLNIQTAPPPEKVARTTRLANVFGEPAAAVDGQEDYYEGILKAAAFTGLAAYSDVFGGWAFDNPRGAAAAVNDVKPLSGLASFWDDLKKAPGRLGAGLYRGADMAYDTLNILDDVKDTVNAPVYAAMSAIASANGWDWLEPTNFQRENRARRRVRTEIMNSTAIRLREENTGNNRISEGLLSGLESVPISVQAIATRDRKAGMSLFFSLTGADAWAEAREQGADVGASLGYALGTGALEAGTEAFALGKWLDVVGKRVPFVGGALSALFAEMAGEQINTFIGDLFAMTHLPENRGMTVEQFIAARPDAAIDTALAVIGGTGAVAGGIKASQLAGDGVSFAARKYVEGQQAKADSKRIGSAVKNARESELRALDPEAFRELIRRQADDAGAQDVFISAEAVRTYQQSDSYDAGTDPFDPQRWAVDDLADLGGDLVIPIEDFLTDIAPSPAWEALKDDMRLAGGGQSVREAMEAEAAMESVVADLQEQYEQGQASDAAQRSVREKLVDRVAGQFGASYTAPVARQIAELAVSRAAARAERLGRDLSLQTLSDLDVRQVMPETARDIKAADQLDLVFNAMRQGKPARYGRGQSLLQWIKARGGINDTGGDLKAMGVPRAMIRDFDPRQSSLLGVSGAGDFGLDSVLRSAIEAGYFPELDSLREMEGVDQLDVNDLLAAIGEEMAGAGRYIDYVDDQVRAAADDLGDALRSVGFDPANMTDEQMREAVDMMVDQIPVDGRAFEQDREEGAVPRGKLLFHGSPLNDLSIDNIEIVRSSGQKQGKKGRVYGGFYAADEDRISDAQGYAGEGGTIYRIELQPGAVIEEKSGDITRLSQSDIESYRARGVDVVTGKDPRGRVEYAIINKDAIASMADNAAAPRAFSQSAFHGSPHKFDRFSTDALGTGEGAQSFGWGLYFASERAVADFYRRTLSVGNLPEQPTYEGKTLRQWNDQVKSGPPADYNTRLMFRALDAVGENHGVGAAISALEREIRKEIDADTVEFLRANLDKFKSPEFGRLYEVEIPDDGNYLRWDESIENQPDAVKAALAGAYEDADPVSGDYDANKLGVSVYHRLAAIHGADKAASLALRDAGIAGIKYKDGTSRGTSGSTYNYVVFDDSAVSIRAYDQGRAENQPRGRIIFDQNMRIIELFEGRNLSTAVHELSHMWLEELREDAQLPDAPDQVVADWQAVQDWFTANGHPLDETGGIPVEAHEMFARSGERYVMEGKAPSSALDEIFRSFKAWMVRLYRSVADLNAPITPEIREVFDRLIATNEEIDAARQTQGISALFADAQAAGMGQTEFEAYERLITRARDVSESNLLAKTMRAITARETKLYKERAEAVREGVEDDLDRTPLFRAIALMAGRKAARVPKVAAGAVRLWESPDGSGWQKSQGEAEYYVDVPAAHDALKGGADSGIALPDDLTESAVPIPVGQEALRISRQWIVDRMGEDALKLLPVRVPPLYAEQGIDPQAVAERAGYASAEEMLNAIIGAEKVQREAKAGGDKRPMRARMIGESVKTEMHRRYGDPLTDGSIEQEALAAVHDDEQGEVMATELRILARRSGVTPTPYRIAKQWARNKIRSGVVATEASASAVQRYQRAAAKAGREAELAIGANDREGAFTAKHKQMVNNALASEARAAMQEVETAVARMGRIAKARTRKSIDQDYLERAQALLEAVDLKRRSQLLINRAGKFEIWANEQRANGIDILAPEGFEAVLSQTNWSRLSVDDLLVLDDAIKQIMHLGSLKQTLKDNQEQRDFEATVSEAERVADDIGRKALPSHFDKPTVLQSIKSRILSMDAALLKMEQVFLWLDNGNPEGVFNRIVWRPLAEAQSREKRMVEEYHGKILALMEGLPKEVRAKWGDKIVTPFIHMKGAKSGQSITLERSQVIAMALNWGNAGNRQRLLDGNRWSEASVQAFLMGNLEQAEWQFVQSVWDSIAGLWPEIQKVERNVNGFAPEAVEAVEIVTPFGTYSGGYYPAVYDPRGSMVAKDQGEFKEGLLGANYLRATTRASSTKDRVEAVKDRPLLLDLAVISRHLGEVIHDITHREALVQANKFLSAPRIRQLIQETLNPEIEEVVKPWLNFVANSWAMERSANAGFTRFMRDMRANVTVVGMGWRFTTVLTQVAGYSNSVAEVGAARLAMAIGRTVRSPLETWAFVKEQSLEMRERLDTLDVNIGSALRALEDPVGNNRTKLFTAAKRFAFHGIGYMDRIVTVPTWMAAYDKAVEAGAEHADAVQRADQIVRLSQGAGGAKDLSGVQQNVGQGGELMRQLTMFYSYMSAFYNRQRDFGRRIRRVESAKDMPALLARAWWLFIVPPLLAELLSGRGPDDDDEEGQIEWALRSMTSQMVGGVPLARDLYPIFWDTAAGNKTFGYRMTPVQGAGESAVSVWRDMMNIIEGKDTKRATRNAIELTGYATGLTTGQMGSTAQFLVDVGEGDADPQSWGDWYEGLTKGKIKDD